MSGAGPVAIVRHADGTAVQVGDRVLIEHVLTPGVVEYEEQRDLVRVLAIRSQKESGYQHT